MAYSSRRTRSPTVSNFARLSPGRRASVLYIVADAFSARSGRARRESSRAPSPVLPRAHRFACARVSGGDPEGSLRPQPPTAALPEARFFYYFARLSPGRRASFLYFLAAAFSAHSGRARRNRSGGKSCNKNAPLKGGAFLVHRPVFWTVFGRSREGLLRQKPPPAFLCVTYRFGVSWVPGWGKALSEKYTTPLSPS